MLQSFSGVAFQVTAAVGTLAVAGAVVRDLSGKASDLAESQNKVNVVFGSGAEAVTRWSETADVALGLSRRGALDNAGAFGNLFVQLGLSSGKAAEMSTSMVGLAADFASFHNADITDVLIAQQAAFRGEYDAVQRFVPTINAAAVEQQGLRMGLAATSRELSQQDKALATYTLLVEGAGAATGDFARTSDGLANQQRILAAQVENLQAKLGEALLPVVTDLVVEINKLLDANGEEWASAFAEGVDLAVFSVGLLAEKVGELDSMLRALSGSGLLDLLWAGAKGVFPALGALELGVGALRGAKSAADLAATEGGRGSGLSDAEVDPFGTWVPPAKPGSGETPPLKSGGGAGRRPTAFSAASLGLIDQIVSGVPAIEGASFDAAGLAEFRAAEREFADIRRRVNQDMGALALQLADLDARGLENTDQFAALEDRLGALKDASGRIDLYEDLRLGPLRDGMELTAAAIDRVTEAGRRFDEQSQQWFKARLDEMAQNVKNWAPGTFEMWAGAAGLTPIGGFGSITFSDNLGNSGPVEVTPA